MLRLTSLKKKESKSGKPYWSGLLGTCRIMAFETPYGLSITLKEMEETKEAQTNTAASSETKPRFISVKQVGRLYAIARASKWPKESVRQVCVEKFHVIPEDLDNARYEEACKYFTKTQYTVSTANQMQAKAQEQISKAANVTNQAPALIEDYYEEEIPF